MRVSANVQDNQVLVWANEIEMEEVRGLLVKLGELPPPGGRQSTLRVVDASRQPETFEYLKKLKEQWERVSPNPLIIPGAEELLNRRFRNPHRAVRSHRTRRNHRTRRKLLSRTRKAK